MGVGVEVGALVDAQGWVSDQGRDLGFNTCRRGLGTAWEHTFMLIKGTTAEHRLVLADINGSHGCGVNLRAPPVVEVHHKMEHRHLVLKLDNDMSKRKGLLCYVHLKKRMVLPPCFVMAS